MRREAAQTRWSQALAGRYRLRSPGVALAGAGEVALSFPLARPFLAHPAGCCSSRGRQSRGESKVGEQEGGAGCPETLASLAFPTPLGRWQQYFVLCKDSWMAQLLALPTRTRTEGSSPVASSLGTFTQSFMSVSPRGMSSCRMLALESHHLCSLLYPQ